MKPDTKGDVVAAQVAATTASLPITVWGFGVGGALSGLVRAGLMLDRPEYVDHVAELVGPSLHASPDPTDHLISIEALQALASVRPDIEIDDACERWLVAVLHAQRLRAGSPRVHRPDLPRWSSTIWVDCMHTDGPGLAALGYRDEAAAYVHEYATVLQRADGLFHHGYDVDGERGNGVPWGRGQAWALLGLVDTARQVPDDGLRDRLGRLVQALARHEDDGRWHTVVNDPESPIENSVAAYVAYGVGRAIDAGLVGEEFRPMTDRAWATTFAALTGGGLPVSEATPVGDVANYVARSVDVFAWGQAPVLHTLLDRQEKVHLP